MTASKISEEYREKGIRVPAWLLLEWLQDTQRKPAQVAFTEGPLRVIASAIEALLTNGDPAAARKYLALLASLHEPGQPLQRHHSAMPAVVDPLNNDLTYTRSGFDAVMTSIVAQEE